ncbi:MULTISPECIES: hypothetical protein [Nocardiopsis]|uniref:hypothetical protein n=1 Tax=Nocardiopsis TaxID=2013 RepID=UPI0009898623|nr:MULTISPECIES: hypothetical protein [Nocardiopsis]
MNSLTKLWVTLSAFVVPTSEKDDRGAGIVEYAAILILVAAVAFAVYQLGLAESISSGIRGAVDGVLRGPSPQTP